MAAPTVAGDISEIDLTWDRSETCSAMPKAGVILLACNRMDFSSSSAIYNSLLQTEADRDVTDERNSLRS